MSLCAQAVPSTHFVAMPPVTIEEGLAELWEQSIQMRHRVWQNGSIFEAVPGVKEGTVDYAGINHGILEPVARALYSHRDPKSQQVGMVSIPRLEIEPFAVHLWRRFSRLR